MALTKAEQAKITALTNLIQAVSKVKLADLDGKFVVVPTVSESGNVYVENGDRPQFFAIKGTQVYHVTDKQFADPTKGKLVIALDTAKKQVTYVADHVAGQFYERLSNVRQTAYYGEDGQALLLALKDHIISTYNVHTYDAYVTDAPTLNSDVKANATSASSASTQNQPASVNATSTAAQESKPASSGK